ncbi:ABC transporter substrate-binding protein [Halobacillus sp. A5]|uniref:ABC transporter substrate-binding protein n=1 Tax=Halobacillus sp. A5 TaxID=2880263 RepID=UPI0020A63A3D|nr:sugar ABC transporter substrate-binding protein [Halobacillus sp. A5]MCP3028469.1 sugar ABC transporter substrate-binding protein [Halobacillus sp. A5]
MKYVVMAAALAVALFLTACSDQETNSTQGEETISMWVQTSKESPEGEVMFDTVQQFNEEYEGTYEANIEFIPRSGGGGGYEDKVNAAVSTDTLPDVLTLDGPNTAAYAEADIIAPIGEYLSDKDDFLPSIIDQGTYEDELYAIGYSESGVGIFYNKDMFEEAGIDLDSLPTVEDPWDWDQFMDLSKKLTEAFDTPAIDMGLDDKSEWLMYAFAPFLWSQGGQVVSEDGEQATGVFNNEDGLKAMSFIQEMQNKNYTTISPSENGFETGKYPMMMSGSWSIQMLETSYQDIDYDIMPYPVSPDTNELVSPTGSWQYAMSTSAENEEAAGALIDFLTTTEALGDISLGNTVLPARYSAAEELEDQVTPQMNKLIEQNTASGQPRPVIPAYPQVTRAFQQTVTGLSFYENTDELQQLLDEKAQEMQTAIDRRN